MFKRGVLAWLLRGKGKVVSGVVSDVVDQRDNLGLRVYRREEGEETDKYTVIICNTQYAMLTCSPWLPKDMSKSFSYFRIKVEFSNRCIGTITGNGLKVAGSPP